MSKHQPTPAAQLKQLLSLLFKAQSIAVKLDLDLTQKVTELFGRNIPWAPIVNPMIVHKTPGDELETDCVKLSDCQRLVMEILSKEQVPMGPKEIHRKIIELPDTITHCKYSRSSIRGALIELKKKSLVSRHEGRSVYSAK